MFGSEKDVVDAIYIDTIMKINFHEKSLHVETDSVHFSSYLWIIKVREVLLGEYSHQRPRTPRD